jgi:biopolymer transport protein ExbD
MANVAPGRRPRGHRSQPKPAKVLLTPLVDSMLILLVFLIKSFDAEGELFTVTEGLQLPISTAQKKPERSLIITIAKEDILVAGEPVALVSETVASPDLIIPGLAAALQKKKELTEMIAQQSTTIKFKGELIIEGDRAINYALLQKVLYTSGQAGYSNFSFAVMVNE